MGVDEDFDWPESLDLWTTPLPLESLELAPAGSTGAALLRRDQDAEADVAVPGVVGDLSLPAASLRTPDAVADALAALGRRRLPAR